MSTIDWKSEGIFLRQLLQRLAFVYLAFTSVRLLFLLYNFAAFEGLSLGEGIGIFLAALRFDTSAILYVNALVILLHVLPLAWRGTKAWQGMQQVVFCLCNIPVLFIEMADVAYFPFAFRRILRSDFEMQSDIENLLPQFMADYWHLAIVCLLLFTGVFIAGRKTAVDLQSKQTWWLQGGFFLLTVGLSILGMRGGLQPRPISASNAANYVSNTKWMPLVTNSTLNIIHSFQQRSLSEKRYHSAALAEELVPFNKVPNGKAFKGFNVVILAVESMGHEYLGYFHPEKMSSTPFMDSLMKEGLFFEHCMANGTRSSQGVVSLVAGLPALMPDPYVFSSYQGNRVLGLGNLLGAKGYESGFFHGGEVGTMDFNKFAPQAGFKHYYGKEDYQKRYPQRDDYDGHWGIWDKAFYSFMLEELDAYQEPFVAMNLSMNPHHPFKVPADFTTPATEPIWQSIAYADDALRSFWEAAEKKDWFERTVFVITADHIGPILSGEYNNRQARYRIPLWIYCAGDTSLKARVDTRLCQQIDVLPTVLDYLNFDRAYGAFGTSLLQENSGGYHYTFENDLYQLIDKRFVLQYNGEEMVALFDYRVDPGLEQNILGQHKEEEQRLLQRLQAMIQQHNRVLIKNSFHQYNF